MRSFVRPVTHCEELEVTASFLFAASDFEFADADDRAMGDRMGRGSYIGGSTVINPGSGFFSHKGGPGRAKRKDDGSDQPGPAKLGSKCNFGPLRSVAKRKKIQVIEFKIKSPTDKALEKEAKQKRRLASEIKELQNKIAASVITADQRVSHLERELANARSYRAKCLIARKAAGEVDVERDDVERTARELQALAESLSLSRAKPAHAKKKPSRKASKPSGARRPGAKL
ncbi:hypothetical protein [Mesorhizobium sp.]|uniref:hypothetical protein n=1 Tax=Mesorhizobium sp. TaxID=1871066 RepID=UPI000FE6E777|nr:hypothetical protein [Mesorhizobium sp.]RWD44090.1 MAG: hypothetical protein EOS35_18225 [Mesorhizobium sp.]